jgi:hypothetical protein
VLDQGLLSVDLLSLQFRRTRLRPDPDCPACGRGGELVTPDVVCRTGG